jgi:hypothetical protein
MVNNCSADRQEKKAAAEILSYTTYCSVIMFLINIIIFGAIFENKFYQKRLPNTFKPVPIC